MERPSPENAERTQKPLEQELESQAFKARRRAGAPRTRDDLHVCPSCASELVHPTDWEATDPKHWRVDLRCPECKWIGGGIYGQGVLDRFDQALDRATEQVLDDLRVLARANMEDEIERFAEALHAGHILPEDF